jgi:hypothetical protein
MGMFQCDGKGIRRIPEGVIVTVKEKANETCSQSSRVQASPPEGTSSRNAPIAELFDVLKARPRSHSDPPDPPPSTLAAVALTPTHHR